MIVTIALIDTDSFAATMIRDQVVISKESAKEELNAIDPAEDEEFCEYCTA